MLMNGLQYIIPCQNRFSSKSLHVIVQNEFERISTSIKNCLNQNQMSTKDERATNAFSKLERLMYNLHSKPLSRKLYRRARREYKTIKRLQQFLHQQPDLIIRPIDKSRGFYIGNRTTIELKTQEYMNKTQAYEEITDGHCPLSQNLSAVQTVLDYLVKQKAITKTRRNKLLPSLNKLELAHLYTIPKVHKPDLSIRPIMAGIHAPTSLLSKFLNNLLAPIYLKVAQETTFTNSIDFVRKLETYVAHGFFKTTTQFITMDVENLYTMIPRDGALEALARFLDKHSKYGKIGPFNIHMIMKMARLILDTNHFVYNNKYYRQVRGGAMGSAFTQVLANIYMLEWEYDLIQYQTFHYEIYGRYIDDIFMTTNQTMEKITIQLEKAQTKDMNIKVQPTISTTIHFLDVTIVNENGKLRTMIYHKPTAEPYYLPYQSDHSPRIHRNIPYNALLRAARLCSHVQDFNSERLRIDMSLLLNNYPRKFIQNQFLRFFQVHRAEPVLKQLDANIYKQLHEKLLYQPTRKDMIFKDAKRKNFVLYPPVLQNKFWNPRIMYLSYTFQTGPMLQFPYEFYQWWKEHYQYPGSPTNKIKILFIPKMDQTLRSLLIHKKPSRKLLKRMDQTNI